MRPTASCTMPPPVHSALGTLPAPPPPPPPPVLTVKASALVVVALPPRLALSCATTYQLHAPSVKPERFTLQVSPAPRAALNDCTGPVPWRTLIETLFTPLA